MRWLILSTTLTLFDATSSVVKLTWHTSLHSCQSSQPAAAAASIVQVNTLLTASQPLSITVVLLINFNGSITTLQTSTSAIIWDVFYSGSYLEQPGYQYPVSTCLMQLASRTSTANEPNLSVLWNSRLKTIESVSCGLSRTTNTVTATKCRSQLTTLHQSVFTNTNNSSNWRTI